MHEIDNSPPIATFNDFSNSFSILTINSLLHLRVSVTVNIKSDSNTSLMI